MREPAREERRGARMRDAAPFRELSRLALEGLSKAGPSPSAGLAPNWKRRGVFLMRHYCQARLELMGEESAEGFLEELISVASLSRMAYCGKISEASASALRSYLSSVTEFREDWAREGRFSEACVEHHWWLGYQLSKGLRSDLAMAFYERAEGLRALLGEPLAFPETDAQWGSMLEALEIGASCEEASGERLDSRL